MILIPGPSPEDWLGIYAVFCLTSNYTVYTVVEGFTSTFEASFIGYRIH